MVDLTVYTGIVKVRCHASVNAWWSVGMAAHTAESGPALMCACIATIDNGRNNMHQCFFIYSYTCCIYIIYVMCKVRIQIVNP